MTMELREFAERILFGPTLEEKLAPPAAPLVDERPGPPQRVDVPARTAEFVFARGRRGVKMPHDQHLRDPGMRGVAHHVMANHELQAVEVMAWTLLAFPEAPRAFRRGLVQILQEEQQHTQWHAARAAELGAPFGSLPVAGYVWRRAQASADLCDYLACLPLTFEAANLDHSLHYESRFAAAGDPSGAALMRSIHDDEIRHVAFGLAWLRRLKEEGRTDWQAYSSHLHWPLRAWHARGRIMDEASRRAAGFDEEFIGCVAAADGARPPHTMPT